jgi:hypothetical protein
MNFGHIGVNAGWDKLFLLEKGDGELVIQSPKVDSKCRSEADTDKKIKKTGRFVLASSTRSTKPHPYLLDSNEAGQ